MPPLNLALTVLLLASICLNTAIAQPPAPNADTQCGLRKNRNDDVAKLLASSNDETRRNLIGATVAGNPSNTLCLMDSVKRIAPAHAKNTLSLILTLLDSQDEQYAALIQSLLAENPELVSLLADEVGVEPAAGDETSPADFFTTTAEETPLPPENPQQLNMRTDAPSVSPASPADL